MHVHMLAMSAFFSFFSVNDLIWGSSGGWGLSDRQTGHLFKWSYVPYDTVVVVGLCQCLYYFFSIHTHRIDCRNHRHRRYLLMLLMMLMMLLLIHHCRCGNR